MKWLRHLGWGLFILVFSSCHTIRMAPLYDSMADTLRMPEVGINAGKAIYQGSKTKYFDLLKTELRLRLDFKTRSIDGSAVLTVKPHAYGQDTLVLDAKGFNIKSVNAFAQNDLIEELPYKYDKSLLKISLKYKRDPSKPFDILIKYSAFPQARIDSGVIKSREKIGLAFINPDGHDSLTPTQAWSQGETEYNSTWFPTIESTDQKMLQEIFLTVDSSYITLSNGKLISKTSNNDGTSTWDWKMNQPHSPYLAMIAVGKWKVFHDFWRGKTPVDYYLEPKYAPYAKMIFGNTPEMIEYFSKILKFDYPWPKFSQVVVREYTSGAMENTSAVVHFDLLQHDRRAHMDNTYEDVISHELFHHWFGDLVTCESWDYLALNESFATFGEFLWREHKYGANEGGLRRQEALTAYLREASYSKEAIVNHYYKDPEDLFDRHRYEKGGLVLNMLREYLGEDVFFKGLNKYLTDRAYKTTEMAYLRMAMEEASGEDLKWFFTQWFDQPGHPDLQISHSYDVLNHKLSISVKQLQQEGFAFRIPVDVDIYLRDKVLRRRIILKQQSDSFVFSMNEEPLLVNFDAGKALLCHKVEGKNTAEWLYQYHHAPLYLDKYEALQALAAAQGQLGHDSLAALMHAGLNASFWALRKTTMEIFFDKVNNYQGEFREKIHTMALKDPSSHVRAFAVATIEAREKAQGENIYRKAINDSSYAVVTAGLEAIFTELPVRDSADKLLIAEGYESYNSPEVLQEITDLYAVCGGPDRVAFFHKLPYITSKSHLNNAVLGYRKFLLRMNASVIKSEMPFLFRLENKMRSFWEQMTYKDLLSSVASSLKDGKMSRGGLSSDEVKAIAGQLQAKADGLDLKKYGY